MIAARRLVALLAAFALVSGSGCASTLATGYTKAAVPFVGTFIDGYIVGTAPRAPGYAALALLDLPFSFALDTVLLPVTGTRALANAKY